MDHTVVELIKWAGPWAAFVVYALKEFKERRQVDEILKRYEGISELLVDHLKENSKALTKVCERFDEGEKRMGSVVDHISYSTQVLSRLCAQLDLRAGIK